MHMKYKCINKYKNQLIPCTLLAVKNVNSIIYDTRLVYYQVGNPLAVDYVLRLMRSPYN